MPKITPCLWFNGNAKEAVDYYLGVFPNSKIVKTEYYPTEGLADFQKEFAGKELTVEFELDGQRYVALNADSSFKFNEAVSFMIDCKDQDEIEHYWKNLSAVPESEQCGWCKDKFGLSWQVVPADMDEILAANPKAFQALMEMHKIVIDDLKNA